MVGKLFKHEFIALGRVILPVTAVILATVFLFSLTLLFPSNAMEVLQILFESIFIFISVGMLVLTFSLCSYRFQKSIFSKEGYLTLSLPVSPMQLILVKAVTSVVAINFSFWVTLLCFHVVSAVYGENFIGGVISNVIHVLSLEGEDMIGVWLYLLFFLFMAEISGCLFVYACISANRTRFGSISFIVAWLILMQLFSFIFEILPVEIQIPTTTRAVTAYSVISLFLVEVILFGVFSALFIRYILKKKINLVA